mgnify:CR=1 FL=1
MDLGRGGGGKSHLLQAVCAETGERVDAPHTFRWWCISPGPRPPRLRTTGRCGIDDLQIAAGDAGWEQAIFNLPSRFERASAPSRARGDESSRRRSAGASGSALQAIGSSHPASEALSEAERIAALRIAAAIRGLEIPE